MIKSPLFLALLTTAAIPAFAEQVAITEIMYHPPGLEPEFVEVVNLTSNVIDMANWQLTGGAQLTLPDFNAGAPSAHLLREYERILLTSGDPAEMRSAYPGIPAGTRIFGRWKGSLGNAGDLVRLQDATGALQSELTYGDNGKWPVAADGAGHSLVVINENRAVDDWRNWQASPRRGGSPGQSEIKSPEEPAAATDLSIIVNVTDFNSSPAVAGVVAPPNPADTKWKYYAEQAAPPAGWNTVGFDDSGWGPSDPALGYAPLGFEPAAGSSTFPGIRTPIAPNQPLFTYYFRTTFNWTGPLTGNTYSFDEVIDDGVVVWLNGQIIGRDRLSTPTTPLHTSPATAASSDGLYETGRMANTTGTGLNGKLVAGVNTLAVEVHNRTSSDNDLTMALRLQLKIAGVAGVVVNEVKPSATPGAGFIEFYNPLATAIDLNGYYLSDDEANLTKYPITQSLVVDPGGLATLDYVASGLPVNGSPSVFLTRPDGFSKASAASISLPTDSRSVGRKPMGGSQWFYFVTPTPGAPNQSSSLPVQNTLSLSEAHFNAAGHVDWVEIRNSAAGAASGDGLFVAATRDFAGKVALPASVPAGGFASIPTDFGTDGGDVVLYLVDVQNNVLGTAELSRRDGLPSVQEFPAGSGEWFNAATPTPDAANAPEVRSNIVITEIMFAPPSSQSQGEFIEIYNRGTKSVNLAGWRFVDGLDYSFGARAMLLPGQYGVVAVDPDYMKANYPGLATVFGPAQGSLRNRGELIRLEDERGNLADAVDYRVGGQWPTATGGEGSSLELLHPDMDNSLPSSWRASDESHKTTLQTYTYTDTYRQLRGTPTPAATSYKELYLSCVGDAHVLLKGITLTKDGSTTNLITTGDATSHNGNGATGFLCTGTHSQSDTVPQRSPLPLGVTAIVGDDGFHLISTGTGDTKNNKAEVDCIGIAKNDLLTLTFQARWISGLPLLVAQTWDRSFGKVFRLPIPNNLGTPGAPNSRPLPAAAPTVDDMRHSPAVPSSIQSVVVTARVSSPMPPAAVELLWRLDTIAAGGDWTSTPMNDGGTGGDTTAGDGIWSAATPPQADKAIVQFYIRATAANGQANECPRNGAAQPGLWIVDNVPPTSRPGTVVHRFVVSKYHRDALGPNGFTAKFDFDFPRMSNFEFNTTVILGETSFAGGPDILYNSGMRKGGSPWTRDASNNLDRMRWKSPGDNLYRNRSKTGVDNDSAGANRFHNRMVRYMLHLLGYPVPDHEFIQQIVNETDPRIGDDMEPTDADFFDRAYAGGSEGELFEIDDAWFMYDGAAEDRIPADSVTGRWAITDWTSTVPAYPSADSPIFYHGNFPVRFPEDRYDYGALAAFIRTVATGTPATDAWRAQVEQRLDVDRAAIYAAVRGYIGDWDNFTLNRGKNGYMYRRPTDGKFEFHHWDSDLGFDTGTGFLGNVASVGWTNFSGRPWFRQRMNYYVSELVTRYTKGSARMQAWLGGMNRQSANPDKLAPFNTKDTFNYPNYFSAREKTAIDFINSSGGKNYDRQFSITTTPDQTVSTPLFTLEGGASSKVWMVDVGGHPEAVMAWVPETGNFGKWRITGIALGTGLNTLTVRAVASDGSVIASLPFGVTLSVNAPPVASLTTNPVSLNVAAGELLVLDATGSFDPEGAALSFAWSIAPLTGVSVTHPVPGRAEARFTAPGIYTAQVTVTDPGGLTSTLVREITVYAADDFRTFGEGSTLGGGLTAENIERRDNYSPSSWYSLEDRTGSLLIQVLDQTALPLSGGAFPLVARDLPDTGNWLLQSDVGFDTRNIGSFQAGLLVDFTEAGVPMRYVFGPEGRSSLTVRRSVNGGPFITLFGAVRLNAGGPDIAETDGTLWNGDAYFTGGSPFSQAFTFAVVNSTLNDTGRLDPAGFAYAVPVPNGPYDVVLRAATGAGALTQDVTVNGTTRSWSVATGLNTAEKTLSFSPVNVSDGMVNVSLARTGGANPNALITALEIVPPEVVFTALRIQRLGTQLVFARQTDPGMWTAVAAVPIAASAIADRGGLFVATDVPQTVRMSFDYLLVANPTKASSQLANLRLTEIMYNPAGDGVEYVELRNVGAENLDLTGVNFPEGQPFAAYTFDAEILAPGEFIVLTSNKEDFRKQYGPSARLADPWTTGILNNGGETIVLRDSETKVIHEFTYRDDPPWPTSPDGLGPSLEVIDVNGDYTDPANWRASFEPTGSPGADGLGRDSDGDGQSDGVESFFGTNPTDGSSVATVSVTASGSGAVTLSWPSVAGRSYRIERTTDFVDWTPLQTTVATDSVSTFIDSNTASNQQLFYRTVALPLP